MKKINLIELEANLNTFIIHKECANKRRKDWQKRNKALKIHIGDYVKLAVSDTNGEEHLWFEVKEVSPFIGRCDNAPILIKKVKYNDLFQFRFKEIEDYEKNGKTK